MPTLQINDSTLYYETHGEGPALVLAHGVGGNHAIWYKQIATFAKSYQVVVFDHRGFGLSTDAEGLGRSAYVSDLVALLDHLKIDKAAFVGQSMGGGTVIAFAKTCPERVSALVVADSLHAIVEPADVAAIMDKARAATADLDQLERVLGAGFREKNAAESLLYRGISSFNATNRKTLKGDYAAKVTPEELAALNLRILFITGMEDVLFPVEAIRKVQERVAGSFLVEVSGAGHSAFFESPTEFNDSILSFLMMAGYRGVRRSAHSNAAGYTPVKA